MENKWSPLELVVEVKCREQYLWNVLSLFVCPPACYSPFSFFLCGFSLPLSCLCFSTHCLPFSHSFPSLPILFPRFFYPRSLWPTTKSNYVISNLYILERVFYSPNMKTSWAENATPLSRRREKHLNWAALYGKLYEFAQGALLRGSGLLGPVGLSFCLPSPFWLDLFPHPLSNGFLCL